MKKGKVSYKMIVLLMVFLLSMSGCSFFNRLEEGKNGSLAKELDAKKNELAIPVFADENIADFIQVNPEKIPDYEGFMARLENICNIHEENAREYSCEDSTQYAYAVEWLLNPSLGILVWNSHEDYDRPELVSGTERPEDSLLAEQFYHEYEDGYTYYYYAEFDEAVVDWALKNILNMSPINEEGIVKKGIIHQGGKYYIYWGDVGYIPPSIKVTSAYTDGINYYVAFDWQEFSPWDETIPAKPHYAVLRQNNTDRGTVWSIVKTSAEPIFSVSEITPGLSESKESPDSLEYPESTESLEYPGIPFKEILGYDGYYIDEMDERTGFVTRTYYAITPDGSTLQIGGSYQYGEINDTVLDMDGDGVTELITRVTYAGSGYEETAIYRRGQNGIERGTIDNKRLPGIVFQGSDSVSSTYEPERKMIVVRYDVLSESLLHLPLWMIFRHMHINLINVRSTYAS